MRVLRDDLLAGRRVALDGGVGRELAAALSTYGADVEPLGADLDEDAALSWARAHAPLHALVFDAAPSFAGAGLQGSLERGWIAIRAVANGAMIPAQAGGKIALLAPGRGAGPGAQAALEALVNLARTLSIEWARFGITAVALNRGERTDDGQLAELVSFVVSPAGDYFSGCRFDLDLVA